MKIASKLVDERGAQLNIKVLGDIWEACRVRVFNYPPAEKFAIGQSEAQDELAGHKAALDKAVAEMKAVQAKQKETRQLHDELAAGVPTSILHAAPVVPPASVDCGAWLRWRKDARSYPGPNQVTFEQFSAEEAAKAASKTGGASAAVPDKASSAPRLIGQRPANVIQGAYWRLSAAIHTPQTREAAVADEAEREIPEYLAEYKKAKDTINAVFEKGLDMMLQGAFAPVHPGPDVTALQQELAATKAQLAAAQQEVAAAKAHAAAAQAALQHLQQQPPSP